jgi:lysophospholipase L1-like esterase
MWILVSALRAGALTCCLALAASAASSEPLKAPCRVADEYLSLSGRLDRVTTDVREDDALRVLVLGSSSTAGVGASAPERAYTGRLEAELERRLAGVSVEVFARGVGGETALGAVARLKREMDATKPDLVIWQIGTNDAVRRVDMAAFRAAAERGLAVIAQAGVDVALLDPQYVAQDEAAYAPYVGAISQIANAAGVALAHRYAAMRSVAKTGGAEMISRDRLHMNDAGHACVGAFLAEALGRKLAPTPAVAEARRQS